jgi:carbonic anhydrase/acetyltransferase-like protein (isoleucine patch superfamily)
MADIRSFEGKVSRIASDAWLDPTAVVIGDVSIGARSSLWPGVIARGDINSVVIGECTNIQDGSILHVTHDSRFAPGGYAQYVGDHVTVGHRVVLHGCEIGHHCLIGMSATVMDGALVEPYVVLGAGSLVPGGKRLESGHLYVGCPARRIRPITETERAYFDYSSMSYVRLAERYRDRSHWVSPR